MKEENIVTAHQETLQKGLKAPMGEGTTFDLMKDLFFMITLTVGPKEQHYLQPLNALLFKDITTKACFSSCRFALVKGVLNETCCSNRWASKCWKVNIV